MDVSPITDYLYVSSQPKVVYSEQLSAWGVRLIISMRGESRPHAVFGQPPFSLVWFRTYDTFLTPVPVRVLMEGVRAALPVIEAGGRVLVHCQRGKHRSVAMAAAILIALGYSADEAMQLLRTQRQIARPQTWYVKRQIKKFEQAWRAAAQA